MSNAATGCFDRHISGCHLSPAATLGLLTKTVCREAAQGKARFTRGEQVEYASRSHRSGCLREDMGHGLFGVVAPAEHHSPGSYSMVSAPIAEVVLTAFFLLVSMGATDKCAPAGFAPIAIGLGLTLIHLIGIPVTNLSVNPARSTGPAIFVGGWALAPLWLFWVAPLIGGAIGGLSYRALFSEKDGSAAGAPSSLGCRPAKFRHPGGSQLEPFLAARLPLWQKVATRWRDPPVEVAIVFGMPVLIVGLIQYFKYRTRRIELEHGSGALGDKQQLAALLEERKQLEARVQNLETIVTSVDLELNTRLNRLAASQSQLLLGSGTQGTAPTIAAPRGQLPVASPTPTPMSPLAATPIAQLAAGTLLAGRFEIKGLLGSGGMGAVYRAHDRELGEDVALKTISANLAEDPDAVDRFRREVGAARKITHRNVIRIHDLGEHGGVLFLSMEYFAGATLQQLIAQHGKLSYSHALPLIEQIADALSAAHSAGVVHRDLKPLNVLVNERQELRVIDFGLAKASNMRAMTATGVLMGTAEYMSPEQVRGATTDHRSDLYSLAAIAFQMLCGRPPFVGDNPIAVGLMQCTSAPAHPRELVPELPPHVDQAILRGLAKEPNERFASAALFKAALVGITA